GGKTKLSSNHEKLSRMRGEMAAVKVKIPGAVIGSRELSILLLTLFLASAAGGEDLSARDWSEMGNAQVKRGEYQEAIASYDRAIALDGYNPNIWYNKGLALSSLGRYEEALYCYHRGSNLQPFDPDLWIARGSALSGLGRHEEALESYSRAAEFA